MNQLQVFQNDDFGQIRTVTLEGEPWFVGKDVAGVLGYSNTHKALSVHIDAEDKGVTKWDTPGGDQDFVIINESGLYSLILSSKLPSAKKFKRWVTREVLPSIRKTGQYQTPGYQPKATSVGEVVNLVNMTRNSMKAQGCDPREIAIAIKEICDQFNIHLPDCFIKPKGATLQDAMDMVSFIYSQKDGKHLNYEDFIVAQTMVKRLNH